jgi:hypothetical protein
MINITKQIQLTHKTVYFFIFYLSFPRHVSAGNYTIIKGAISKLNHFKILKKILEQQTRKARSQGENSYIGHSTHSSESTNVEAQKRLILKAALYAPSVVSAE